jgi:hypothetical protein
MKAFLVFLLPVFHFFIFQESLAENVSFSKLTDLKIGSALPSDASFTNGHIMVSSGSVIPMWNWAFDGADYQLGVNKSGKVEYISTSSKMVITPNRIHVGMKFSELEKLFDISFIRESGWAWRGKLPSGWHVAIFCGQSGTDCELTPESEIAYLFKRAE